MMLRRAVSNYGSAFLFSQPTAPGSLELLAQGGIDSARPFQATSTLGDIDGIWSAVRRPKRRGSRRLGPATRFALRMASQRQLGDMEGGALDKLTDAGKGLLEGVTKKTERLENALTIITVLSGVAAITGIIGVIRR
jgi:hypothetical protein